MDNFQQEALTKNIRETRLAIEQLDLEKAIAHLQAAEKILTAGKKFYLMAETDIHLVPPELWESNNFGPYTSIEAAEQQLISDLSQSDNDTIFNYIIVTDTQNLSCIFFVRNKIIYRQKPHFQAEAILSITDI